MFDPARYVLGTCTERCVLIWCLSNYVISDSGLEKQLEFEEQM